jgi:hypothetical protein
MFAKDIAMSLTESIQPIGARNPVRRNFVNWVIYVLENALMNAIRAKYLCRRQFHTVDISRRFLVQLIQKNLNVEPNVK